MVDMFERTIGLIGKEMFDYIQTKTICIIGLGGVGGTCFDALLRTGFCSFILVDDDVVCPSNLNRQILYTTNSISKLKVEEAKKYALSINKDCKIVCLNTQISENSISQLLSYQIDYIVDAIDDINGKISIINYARENNIPFIVSLGMANKFDLSSIEVGSLNKAFVDPLGKKLRYELKQKKISIDNIKCVFSKEQVEHNKNLNSLINVTSCAGLYLSNEVFRHFLNDKKI